MGKWALECKADDWCPGDGRRWWLHRDAPHKRAERSFDWFMAPILHTVARRSGFKLAKIEADMKKALGKLFNEERDLSTYKLFDTQEDADKFLVELIFAQKLHPTKHEIEVVYVEDA